VSDGRGLADVSTPELEALLACVGRGVLGCPMTEQGLKANGFAGHSAVIVAALAGADVAGAAAALRAVIAERQHRKPPLLDLVWTGPETSLSNTRDTAVVVRQLFASARRTVLVAGYAFDNGAELLRPLHEGMVQHGVAATLFVEIEGHTTDASRVHAYATEKIDKLFFANWPFSGPRPDVYYDPRTAIAGPPWASLHAKVVVVDSRYTLLGSANFTQRGQERNIEAGVLIEDEGFAERMAAQWQRLVSANLVQRYRG
jgi:phosphatidylserine/phosphatidylglycerophosphate/cardiolipin synthase-like enzyme